MGSRDIVVEEWGMGRTGLLGDLFMVQCIQGFPWPRGRSKGKGLEIVWPGDHQSSDTSIGHASAPMLPLWSCSPPGKAEHSGKTVSGNAATECRYSWVFYKRSVCTALNFGCAHP